MRAFRLVNARLCRPSQAERLDLGELCVAAGRIVERLPPGAPRVDLGGRVILPGLVNGHDHLDFASLPPLGRPPYASVYEWADDVRAGAGDPAAAAGLAVPFSTRVFLGALRNLLAGVTSVAHHGPWRAAVDERFWPAFALLRYRLAPWTRLPVRLIAGLGYAHSPGLEPDLRRAFEATPAGAPFVLHAAEGHDSRAGAEVEALARSGLLGVQARLVHAIALSAEDVRRIAEAGAGVVWCPESNRHLYGRTAPVAALRAAGVRLALGSDSPASGVRDFLSSLAAARSESVLDDGALLRLATSDTAESFGLGRRDLAVGEVADLLVVDELEPLLSGRRAAIALVLRAGQPLLGATSLMAQLAGPASEPFQVEGRALAIASAWAHLLARLMRGHPHLANLAWLREVALDAD